MTSPAGEVTFKANAAAQQHEVYVDGQLAGHAEYRPLEHGRKLPHNELDDLRTRGLNAVPTGPFVADSIRQHPTCLKLRPPEQRRALGLESGV